MDDFDYDKWWSLRELGEYFNCPWYQLPEKSNGIIEVEQEVIVHPKYKHLTNMENPIFIIRHHEGSFKDTKEGVQTPNRMFKIIPNIPILDLSGVYHE